MVEIIIATAIIATAFLSAMIVAQKSIQLSHRALHQAQSALLLEEGAEAVRTIRDNSWASISSLALDADYYPLFSGGVWTLSTTPNKVGIFTRKVTLSTVYRNASSQDIASSGTLDTGAKLVTVTVFWPEGGVTITKTLQFYLLNIFS